jgi:hypothetical protein
MLRLIKKPEIWNFDMLSAGLYVTGWLATGPVGVILSTMTHAFGVGRAVEVDVRCGNVDVSQARPGHAAVAKLLKDRGVYMHASAQVSQHNDYHPHITTTIIL